MVDFMPSQFVGGDPASNSYTGIMPTQFAGAQSQGLNQDQMNQLSLQIFNRSTGSNLGVSPWEFTARYAAGTAIDLADSVWSSPLNPVGDRGDIWSQTSPEMQNFYAANKGLIEGTSAVVGGLGTAIASEAFVIPKLGSMMAASSAISGTRLWQAAEAWNVGTKTAMMAAQRTAAESGEAFSLFGSTAGRQYMMNRAVAGAVAGVRTSPIEYSMFWNNEAFNSGDFATEGFWIGAAAALGGTIGAVGGRATVRRIANSSEIRDIRAAPLSMSGVSNDLLSTDALDMSPKIQTAGVQLKESAYTTEYLLASRSADPNRYDEAAKNAGRLNTLRDEYAVAATDSVQKLVNLGISGVDTAKGKIAAIPEIKNVVETVGKEDPFVFHGLAEVGLPKTSIETAISKRAEHIESLGKQSDTFAKGGNLKEAQRLARLQRTLKLQEGYSLVDGTWLHPDSELAKAATEFDPENAGRVMFAKGNTGENFTVNIPGVNRVSFDASLRPTDGRGATVDVAHLPIKSRLWLNEATGKLINKLTYKNAKTRFVLTKDASKSWFTLDSAAEILERGGKIDFEKGMTTLQTLDDIKRQSLRLKSKAILKETGLTGRITPEIRFKYNLPQPTPMERIEDSAGDNFRAWLYAAADDKNTDRELSDALANTRTIAGVDLRPTPNTTLPRTDGNMFAFNRDKRGTWMKPLLGYFDPKSHIETISKAGHSSAVTVATAERIAVLTQGSTHVNQLAIQLAQMPEIRQAMNVAGLSNDQLTGMGGGVGQAVGEVLPNRFLWRDNATILAASKLQESTERHGRAVFEQLMNSVGMRDIVTKVTSSGNSAQRTMLDQYFSLRPGWDIEGVQAIGEGKYGFELKDTKSNRKRLGLGETDEWTPELMPNERLNIPIVVDDISLSAIQAFNKLTDQLIDADNVIRKSTRLKPVDYKPFFAPAPNTKSKIVGFTMDANDKLMPGRTIVASSQDEYNTLVNRTLAEFGEGSGVTVRSKHQLEKLRDIYDEAQLDWMDPGINPANMKGSQQGGLTGAYVKQGAFNDALEWVQHKTSAQAQDTLRNMMREPLLVSRASAAAERGLSPKQRNAFDVYERALTGRSEAFSETSLADATFKKVEEKLNGIIANSAMAMPARYFVDLAERIGMNPSDLSGKKTFQQISDAMGGHTPFANVEEYLDSRGIKPPPSIKGMASKLNSMAASVYLRWFELPHALLNGLGLMATMPAAIMSGRAPISTFMRVGEQNIGIVDGAQIAARGMKRMWNKGANADWQHMLKNGDATQSVIEYHQQLGSIQSQAGFMKWADKADKWASILSEKSEAWSRQVAHFVGLEMADYHAIQGTEARHNFAREIANSMIADYAPVNRPELFNSGFGSLIGLFQSYALNHYTKMFRWMENGEYGKAGLQAAVQASMFGLNGTYGIGALFDMRDNMLTSGSDPTMVDIIYSRFGPVLGGAIVHGGVSELTQLALWTRGDMSPRIPAFSGQLPAIDIGTKVANGFIDATSAFLNAMPGEGRNAVVEAVQRNMPSRILRSWLTFATAGKEIDAYGQVMTDTQGWLETVSRTIGVRSQRQQSELEAFYAGKGAMERDAGKMEALRMSFRSAVRNAGGNMENVSPVKYFNDYVEAGGNPRSFKTWARNLMRDSDSPRSLEALQGSLSTQRSALETWRYGAYGGWVTNP